MMYKHGQFVGEFTIEELLDQEPPLETYAATRRSDQRPVVLKALPSVLASQREHHGRFLREAEIMQRLEHPALPVLIFQAPADGDQYFVMESFGGESLQLRIAERGRLEIQEACALLDRLLEVLEFLHGEGVVVRNLGPGHLVFGDDDAGGEILRLVDFRTARVDFETQQGQPLTQLGATLGPPEYRAPELVMGGTFDKRCDLYSLGCVAYAMLCGHPPFLGRTAAEVIVKHLRETPAPLRPERPDIPAGLEAWILRLLRKSAKERFFDAAEAREALLHALQHGTLPATVGELEPPVVPAPRLAPPAQRPAPVTATAVTRPRDGGVPTWAIVATIALAGLLAVWLALR